MKAARLTLGGLGLAAMAYALASAIGDPDILPGRHIAFLLTILALHDGALVPAFLLVGVLVHRLVPARYRPIIQAALITTAAVTVVALPLVLGYGRLPDNPSALPRNYPLGLALVLATVWLTATAATLIRYRRRPRPAHPGATTGRPAEGQQPRPRTKHSPEPSGS